MMYVPPGRSRQLQGLAAAMIKLWEKSSIAKIALKRGVQLTTSERMADDIKVNQPHFLNHLVVFFISTSNLYFLSYSFVVCAYAP